MVGYITESAGGDFKPTPEGQHVMICTRVLDLGTQKTEFNGETKHQRKIAIVWELPEVLMEDGRPATQTERYTWSMHEKATLRKILEGWRGRKFREEDFAGPPNGFHIKNVLGVPCVGQIMQEQGANGRIYANLAQIMAFQGKKDTWPSSAGPLMFLDLDNFDQAIFDALPEYWQNLIKQSPEYEALKNPIQGQAGGAPANGGYPDMDDHVPF